LLPLLRAQTSTVLALANATDGWIEVAERIRSSGGLTAGGALPVELTTARATFEQAWFNAGLQERREAGYQKLGKAFSLLIRSYRFQEKGNPDQRVAQTWSDEMINFYRQVASRRELAEAMLEKGAIYLEMSQLYQTDRSQFERISRDGDRLLQDCMSIADNDQKGEVLRYWSRWWFRILSATWGAIPSLAIPETQVRHFRTSVRPSERSTSFPASPDGRVLHRSTPDPAPPVLPEAARRRRVSGPAPHDLRTSGRRFL
jgi:hypothetical protein